MKDKQLPEYMYDLIAYRANAKYNGEEFNMFWTEDEGWSVPATARYNKKGKLIDISIWNVYYKGKDEGCDFDLDKLAEINRMINAT